MRCTIGKRIIGNNNPVFIVAELSCNHLQDFNIAVKTIKAIKKSGADAVKLQTYTPDTMTLNLKNRLFQIQHGTIWDGKGLYQLYQEAYTPWEWQPKLKKIAEELGLVCFSSPFDETAVDFLEKMHVPAYKVAAFEITDIPLIEYIASKEKPVIISTGIATLADIKEAVNACRGKGNNKIILMKCVSAYPAPYEEMNLLTIPYLEKKFKTIVGLSDHTLGVSVPIAAVAIGAKVIEKHFILDRTMKSLDAKFSLEPHEFAEMVTLIRDVEKSLGKPTYRLSKKVQQTRRFRRSLFAVQDIKKGEVFSEENVKSIRPGNGLKPKYLKAILGKKAKQSIKRGAPLTWDLIRS